MMRRLLTSFVLFFATGVVAQAAMPVVKVTASSPESPATLAPQQALYVRVEYQSDQPLRFQATGYLHGIKHERLMMNASPVYPSGHGEALAWLAADPGVQLDGVRVLVYDPNWKLLTSVPYAVGAAWHAGVKAGNPAAWAKTLSDAQQQMVAQSLKQSSQGGTGFWGTFVGLLTPLVFLSVPAYPILQFYAFFRLRGPRRLLSALPLSFMLPTYAFCLYALSLGSNLWPLYAIFLSPLAILIVWGMLWYNRRNPSTSASAAQAVSGN
jgi:hypothetical protein